MAALFTPIYQTSISSSNGSNTKVWRELSSDLLDLIANSTEELKTKVHANKEVSYYQIVKTGVLLFVMPLT
jgi:hypothetical protein